MNLEIKKLDHGDIIQFTDIIKLFEKVFEMKNFVLPAKDYLETVLAKPGFYVFVAMLENKVIGGLTAYVLDQYYSEKPLAYIYDLAVLQQFQRKSVWKKLIAEFNAYSTNNGFEEVFVQADKVDDYALDFYRSTKPAAEGDVVHFYYTLHE